MTSQTFQDNEKRLTEEWEAKLGYKFALGESIGDYVIIPGDETDWLFYPAIQWIKRKIKRA